MQVVNMDACPSLFGIFRNMATVFMFLVLERVLLNIITCNSGWNKYFCFIRMRNT